MMVMPVLIVGMVKMMGGDFAANQRFDLSQSTAIRDTFAT